MAMSFCWVTRAAGQYRATDAPSQANQLTANIPSDPSINFVSTSGLDQSRYAPTYYWKSLPVQGGGAQLLTLVCSACAALNGAEHDVPLVSLLRDTLGDQDEEDDRVTYIWLLTYAHPRMEQRLFSAIPFFYWRVGRGPRVGTHDTKPLMDLSAPERPMMVRMGREVAQWTAFDPLMTSVRASTRAYGSNVRDDERVHVEEALNYLRQAPVADGTSALTRVQLDTIIARLELRDALLGGLVNQTQAMRVGMQSGFEQQRIRARNWDLLRQWAEKTGLLFEPLSLAGESGHFAILWFNPQQAEPRGSSLHSIWKLLGIHNPWNDNRLKDWKGPVYERTLNGSGPIRVIPLAVYSLDYPKLPLMLIDFREKLGVRRREVLQRSVNELTGGIFGLSHFSNWYVYVSLHFYNFVAARHGNPKGEKSRLECYSDFRMELALDQSLDAGLKKNIQDRMRWLSVDPLEAAPQREIQDAIERYKLLESEAGENGRLVARVNRERRFELSSFGESEKARAAKSMLHVATLGLYKQEAKGDDLEMVERDRRVAYQLSFLDSLLQPGTPPEVAYDEARIESVISELSALIPTISSRRVQLHANATLENVRKLSKDFALQAACTSALALIRQDNLSRKIQPIESGPLSLRAVPIVSPIEGGVK